MDFKELRKIARLHARGRLDTLQVMLEDKAKAKAEGKEIRVEGLLHHENRERQKILNKHIHRKADMPKLGRVIMGNWHPGNIFDILNPPTDGSPFKSPYAFGAKLTKRGFKMLGSGAYSYVYGKEGSDRVIKVTRRPDNWIDYIRWAAQNGYCGTFAPRVFSYKRIGDFEVSVIERMEKTARNLDVKHDLRFADKLAELYLAGNTMAGVYLNDLIPGMPKFLSLLSNEFGGENRLDGHGGNFMIRKDGSYCFTDPVYGTVKSTAKRLKAKDFTSLASAIERLHESRIIKRIHSKQRNCFIFR